MIAKIQNLVLLRGITFDEIIIYCFDAPDLINVFDLTGWTPFAEVRSAPDYDLVLNLNPVISNPTTGVVRIPAIQDEQTIGLPEGKYKWDFLLSDPSGQRFGPYIRGSFIIKSKITQGEPVE